MTSSTTYFDKKAFDEVDAKTRETLIKMFKKMNPEHTFDNNADQYGVDIIVKNKEGKPVAYIEAEHTNMWTGEKYPYTEVRMFERKRHFIYGKDAAWKDLPFGPLPVYLSIVNRDYTRALTYKAKDAEKATSRIVNSRNGPEKMYFVPLDICTFSTI